MKTALVAGTTGLVGEKLVRELIKSNVYEKITLISRRETGFSEEQSVHERLVSFDDLAKDEDCFATDDIFVCLGTTLKKAKSKGQFEKVDYEYPVKMAQLAKKQGASRFLIVSAIGADPESSFFYSKVKGRLEEALIMLRLPSLHILRPSLLLGSRNEFRLGEKTAEVLGKPLSLALVGPLEKYKPVKAEHVAMVMCALAQEESSGIHIYESDRIRHLGKVLEEKPM
ncbi:NAD-dependent epimerase/dehydratase family protein [Alteribacter keqinensis]|uniref:NAD-dependent epimerase/dehydratase family protein n=1 Tax=Alteribacter keqinensis TaxID=2483800 RepID=A0A3M7TSZ7_9BACI|nr:NAD-dependent epimerase/dehydratase family protein [Alteribacter keqinensis]RNA67882.1 NAD-dependent epimerase/dehydratase family protein [Alteribacter keqinensis]